METKSFSLASLTAPKMLLLLVVVMMSSVEVLSYRSRYRSSYRRSFLNKNSYSRPSYYRTPKARYTHHALPHGQAIGIPVPIELNGDNFIDDIDAVGRFMPYGYKDHHLIPLEAVLRDLAVSTGYRNNQLPNLMRNIKHEFYIGANKADPILHAILKRYGFIYSGTGLGYGQMGATVPQNEVNDIFQSLGLGGATGNVYGNGLGASTGINSIQSPLPGTNGITDDLFDDFDNSVLGLMGEGTAGIARLQDEPQIMTDASESTQTATSPSGGSDVSSSDSNATSNDVLGL